MGTHMQVTVHGQEETAHGHEHDHGHEHSHPHGHSHHHEHKHHHATPAHIGGLIDGLPLPQVVRDFNRAAAAGAGTGMMPWAQRTVP